MVQSVFRFSDIAVHAIMTHRQEVFSLDQNLSVEQAIPDIISSGFSRIPLYKDNPENITGVVLGKDLMRLSAEGEPGTLLGRFGQSAGVHSGDLENSPGLP